jgi:hypothetical protein
MGKFLKIIRYIANLIATMGACFSEQQQPQVKPESDLTESLLNGQNERSDVNPEQCVSANKPPIRAKVEETPCSGLTSDIEMVTPSSTNANQITVCGSGKLRSCIIHDGQSFKLNSLVFICGGNQLGFTGRIRLFRKCGSDFVMSINEVEFNLPIFFDFLEMGISEGDFNENLVKSAPNDYRHIWRILTSGMKYTASYNECQETKMFQSPNRLVKKRKDPISGDLMVWAHGQVLATCVYEKTVYYLSRVSFSDGKTTIAEIDTRFFSGRFYLKINDVEYDLPNYIQVLQGIMLEDAFKTGLRNANPNHFDKIWKVLTDRRFCHLAIYD